METYLKIIIVIALIFIGEALAIYAEMIGARTHSLNSQPFISIFLKMFVVIAVAGGLLVAGYMLGLGTFKNIWIVSVISITSILIVEPILAYSLVKNGTFLSMLGNL
jgi:uncharacterized membrane protein